MTHPKNIQITAAGTKQTGKDLPVMALVACDKKI
jgi:hypothetical protein